MGLYFSIIKVKSTLSTKLLGLYVALIKSHVRVLAYTVSLGTVEFNISSEYYSTGDSVSVFK